jgi:signal transduction histidine kinase
VTTKPIGQGTGLGLGIVREVVEAHGGTISVRNDPRGGAVFSVDLPSATRALSAPQPA